MPAHAPIRRRRADRIAIAAVAGALAGFAFAVVAEPLHPALVVTSDAAAAVWLVAGAEGSLRSLLARAVVALDVVALALTYSAALGPVAVVSLLLATVLLLGSVAPYAER